MIGKEIIILRKTTLRYVFITLFVLSYCNVKCAYCFCYHHHHLSDDDAIQVELLTSPWQYSHPIH